MAPPSSPRDSLSFGPFAGVSAWARQDSNLRPTDYEASAAAGSEGRKVAWMLGFWGAGAVGEWARDGRNLRAIGGSLGRCAFWSDAGIALYRQGSPDQLYSVLKGTTL